jgi:tRNA A-37 threonylcarbamoyl transferase component Bud32
MNMSSTPECQRCGAPLTPDAPEGLCPRCLIALNLAAPTEIPGETGPHGTKVITPPPPPEEIARRFPQFEILECLGRGGMGVVYKARQPKLNRLVALKILAPERVADPRFAERFEREAQALARLNHPNIVTVHDFGETDGLYYLTMEFVDGVSLRQLLRTRKITPDEALAIVPKICEALQFAHEQGVVHRDIKPENVLMDRHGRVKIADFGIAKIMGGISLPAEARVPTGQPDTGTLTREQVLGTPHYMAPEQVEKPEAVDSRADIYSLGVVFYELLTGELPGKPLQPPSKKVQIDVRLDEIVLRALEQKPELRYQQASALKTQVETIATAQPASPMTVVQESAGPANARRQVKRAAIGILVFGTVSFLLMIFAGIGQQNALHKLPFFLAVESALGLVIVGALQMGRTRAYTLAVVASVLTIITPPACFLGFPLGIWSLIVLSRQEVRKAFGRNGSRISPAEVGHSHGSLMWRIGVFSLMIALAALPFLIRSRKPSFEKVQPPVHLPLNTYDFLAQRPFEQGKMWIAAGDAQDHAQFGLFIYDIDRRQVLGRIRNATPVLQFGDPLQLLCETSDVSIKHLWDGFLSQESLGRFEREHAAAEGLTYWLLKPADGTAKRLGSLPRRPNSQWFPSPDYHYCFVRRSAETSHSEVYLMDLQRGLIEELSAPEWPCGWWDKTNILFRTADQQYVRFDVVARQMFPLVSREQLATFLKSNELAATVKDLHVFSIWNGHEEDFYLTDTQRKWSAENSCLVKLLQPAGVLKLIAPQFKFEWSDHLDPTGRYYLYGGRDSGKGSDGVFLRDLQSGTTRVLATPTTAPYSSLPRFYRDSVIYVRSNALWQVSLDGSRNLQLFPSSEAAGDEPELSAASQPVQKTTSANRSSFPKAAHIGESNRSVLLVHDDVDLHYALFYAGTFGSSSRGSHNTKTKTWADDGDITLRNGRAFGYRRESSDPDHLRVNGREFDLRSGRVLVLKDDGSVAQQAVCPSLWDARDLPELSRLVGAQGGPTANKVAAQEAGNKFVSLHRTELGQRVLDTARDFVLEHAWKMLGESGGKEGDQERVVFQAADGFGKGITFEEVAPVNGKARFSISTEPGVELSAQRIGAAIWRRLGLAVVPDPVTTTAFGPVVERVLPMIGGGKKHYLQFQTGEFFRTLCWPGGKMEPGDMTPEQIAQAGGADVSVFGGEAGFQFIGEGCLFTQEKSPIWEKTTAETVAKSVQRASWITGVIEAKKKDLPATWLFKTARGEAGLLQLLEIVEIGTASQTNTSKPHGVKLRYKLVQQAAKEKALTNASAALKRIPAEAVRLYGEFKAQLAASTAKRSDPRSDPNSVAVAFQELSALEAKLETLIQGTAAEPLAKQHHELTRELQEAVQSQDSVRVKECTEHLIAIGQQTDALFQQAAASHPPPAR